MKALSRSLIFLLAAVSLLNSASAHPGSGIVVDSQGNVFVGDINRGLLKFTPDGKVSVVLKEAGHWTADDEAHNNNLFKRQQVLTGAWADYTKANPPSEEAKFLAGWMDARKAALAKANLPNGFEE